MSVKKILADMYSLTDMNTLTKKIQYYQEFLEVLGKVDPGYPSVVFIKMYVSLKKLIILF